MTTPQAPANPAWPALSLAAWLDSYATLHMWMQIVGIEVRMLARPVEVEKAIPFAQDVEHASYDAAAVQRWWRAVAQADRVFKRFRSGFVGKQSPVHFFWGSFDLAVTRFSGRPAPRHPGGAPNCADYVMVEAYSHECSSAGFWPGGGPVEEAAFYAYAYPDPDGYCASAVLPAAAYYHPKVREPTKPRPTSVIGIAPAWSARHAASRFFPGALYSHAKWPRFQTSAKPRPDPVFLTQGSKQ